MNLLIYAAAALTLTVDLALAGKPTIEQLVAKGWESAEELLKPIFIKKYNTNSANQVAKVSWNERRELRKTRTTNEIVGVFEGLNIVDKVVTSTPAKDLEASFHSKIKEAKDANSNDPDVVILVTKAARCMINTLALAIDWEPMTSASAAIAAAKEEAEDTAACLPPLVRSREVNVGGPPGHQALIEKGWPNAEEQLKAIASDGKKARWNNEKGQMEGVKGSNAVSTLKRVAMEAKLIEFLKGIPKADEKLAKRAGKCVSYCVESAVENGKQTIADIIAEAKNEKQSFISCYDKRQDGTHVV